MCNRFRSVKDISQLGQYFDIGDRINYDFNPNVAPTESVPAWMTDGKKPVSGHIARFGILLSGAKPHLMLNTRVETLRKGIFKTQLSSKRCIVPADGFYEWREENGAKQPYYFYRKDLQPILFACIWDYSDVNGDQVPSFSILTSEPNDLIRPYHDRMPVILDSPDQWLNLSGLADIQPLSESEIGVRPVNPAVNKTKEKNLAKIEAKNSSTQRALFLKNNFD